MAIDMFEQMANQDDFRVQMTWGAAIERKGVFYDEAAEAVRTGRRKTESSDPIERADELSAIAREHWRDAQSKYGRLLELRTGEPEPMGGMVRTSAFLEEYEASVQWARDLIDAVRASQRLVDMQMEENDLTAAREAKLFKDQRTNRDLEVKARLHIATLERQLAGPRAPPISSTRSSPSTPGSSSPTASRRRSSSSSATSGGRRTRSTASSSSRPVPGSPP